MSELKEPNKDEYEALAILLKMHNPTFATDPDRIRASMENFEKDLKDPENLASPNAHAVLIQGRNVLACLLGEELMPEPVLNAAQKKLFYKEQRSAIKFEMVKPKRDLKVIVIDDNSEEIKVINEMLTEWPGLKVYRQSSLNRGAEYVAETIVEQEHDIVLLDEMLGQSYCGSDIAQALLDLDFRGKVVSISAVDRIGYTDLHFKLKRQMSHEIEAVDEFLELMNEVIKSLEQRR